jgi:hypothetical protein
MQRFRKKNATGPKGAASPPKVPRDKVVSLVQDAS